MIVIPMAGLSRRFTEAGYVVPKYMLEAHGRSLFDWAVMSFSDYFEREPFLFIARDVAGTMPFVDARCRALGIANARCIPLTAATRGQAETVMLGLDAIATAADEAITIFNIDTFRPGFVFPGQLTGSDGFLEVFKGQGHNWSFARPVSPGSDQVVETAEKVAISEFCCTGLYHFSRMALFKVAYEIEARRKDADLQGGELYVAPLYNYLIEQGRDVRMSVIDRHDVIFCGVPDEYEAVLAKPAPY